MAIAESNNIEAFGYVISARAAKEELLAGFVCVAARERKCKPSQDMQPHTNIRNPPGIDPHDATAYGIDSIPVPRMVLHTVLSSTQWISIVAPFAGYCCQTYSC